MNYALEKINPPLAPGIHVRWRQKSHSAEDIDCADVLLPRESGLRNSNNPFFQPLLTIGMRHTIHHNHR